MGDPFYWALTPFIGSHDLGGKGGGSRDAASQTLARVSVCLYDQVDFARVPGVSTAAMHISAIRRKGTGNTGLDEITHQELVNDASSYGDISESLSMLVLPALMT